MSNFGQSLRDLRDSPVFILLIVDVLFLFVLIYVFKSNTADELRTVIKDAFIGWNGSLAIAITVERKDIKSIAEPGGNNDGKTTTSSNTSTS